MGFGKQLKHIERKEEPKVPEKKEPVFLTNNISGGYHQCSNCGHYKRRSKIIDIVAKDGKACHINGPIKPEILL